MRELTQARLKELLHYNPDSGVFTRIITTSGNSKKGSIAGSMNSDGYILISIDYRSHRAHRLAFLYMEGAMPAKQVDHLDHVRTNNKWSNLRAATGRENSKNRTVSKRNKSGANGVFYCKHWRRWRAHIGVNGKMKTIGYYKTHYAACYARHYANIKYNYHDNHGMKAAEK